jgi:hypothetical protein
LHEDEWEQERYDVEAQHPFFDDVSHSLGESNLSNVLAQNPNYPIWVSDANNKYPTPYPRLGYVRRGEAEETGGERAENTVSDS